MLENIELFTDLSTKELADIQQITKRITLKRGEVIFAQGEFSRDFYVIEAGQVDILVADQLSEPHVVATLRSGDFFGEMALFDKNSPRSATARSAQNSTLLQIPGKEFEMLLQTKPNLSFKLLGALSRRLRDSNIKTVKTDDKPKELNARVISVASPRTGDGKTTFAMTLSHHLAKELRKQVLYIDLDLTFADGTYFMGVYSIRTICDLLSHLPSVTEYSHLAKHLVSLSDTLSVLPGTINVVDGERIKATEFINLLKICRKFFDYIVIDTESRIEDIFLNALDISDRILFLVDPRDLFTVKCASRYFAGIRKLNYADERMAVIATKVNDTFDATHLEKMLKLPVFGALPLIAGYSSEYGVCPFQKAPNSAYVQFVRRVSAELLKEAVAGTKTPGGFLSRLFFGGTENTEKGVSKAEDPETCGLDFPNITPENLRVLMKYVRVTFLNGKFEEARRQTQHILNYCPKSALVYQVLGEIFQAENSVSDAIECFRKAMDLDAQNHYAIGQLGILGNDDALFNRAIQIVTDKIKEHPRYPDLHKDLGVLHLSKRMIEPAMAAFRHALEVNPNYGEARVYLAESLGRLGRFQEAVESLAAIKQKTIRVYYLLGNYLHTLGRFHEAIDAYRMVLKINPSYEDTSRRLEKLESYFEKVHSLIEMHEEIIRDRPSFPDIHMKLGMMYAVVGRRADAEKAFRKALELNPNYEDARRYLDQLSQTPEIHLEAAEHRSHPDHACHSVVCPGFSLHVKLGDWTRSPVEKLRLENYLIRVENVRTGKVHTIRLTPDLVSKGEFEIKAEQICPITEGDLVLARIIDPQTNEALLTIPYTCDHTKTPNCSFSIELSEPLRQVAAELGAVPAVQHFLVSIESSGVTKILESAHGKCKAVIENPRNGLSAPGKADPDAPGSLSFVLHSASDSEPAVLADDRLRLIVQDEKNHPLLDWSFTVHAHDLKAFRKVIALDSTMAGAPN